MFFIPSIQEVCLGKDGVALWLPHLAPNSNRQSVGGSLL